MAGASTAIGLPTNTGREASRHPPAGGGETSAVAAEPQDPPVGLQNCDRRPQDVARIVESHPGRADGECLPVRHGREATDRPPRILPGVKGRTRLPAPAAGAASWGCPPGIPPAALETARSPAAAEGLPSRPGASSP